MAENRWFGVRNYDKLTKVISTKKDDLWGENALVYSLESLKLIFGVN